MFLHVYERSLVLCKYCRDLWGNTFFMHAWNVFFVCPSYSWFNCISFHTFCLHMHRKHLKFLFVSSDWFHRLFLNFHPSIFFFLVSFTTNCVTSYEGCCTDSSLSHWWPADITDCAKETRKKPDASSGDRVRSFLCMNVAVSLQQVSDGNVCIDEPANRIQFKLWMSEVNLSHFHQKNARISLQNPLQADYLHLIWLLWPLSTDACASSVFFFFFFSSIRCDYL